MLDHVIPVIYMYKCFMITDHVDVFFLYFIWFVWDFESLHE